MDSSSIVLHLLNSTTNPEQPLAIKIPLGGCMQSRGPLRVHLAAKDYPEFDVEFDKYSIIGDESMSHTSLLQGVHQICFLQY